MEKKRWNKLLCTKEALRYKTKSEFNRGSVGAYTHALKHGYLDEICTHMGIKWQKKWTNKKDCHSEALKYQNRSDFQRKSNGAYTYALRHDFLDEICTHMENHHIVKWNSKKACAEEALKYHRRIDFNRNSNSAYTYALKHGYLDDICGHMTSYGILSEEKEKARTNYVLNKICITKEEWKDLKCFFDDSTNSKTYANRMQRCRCIYACEFCDNYVYIGLTNNIRQRIKQHLRDSKSCIFKHIEETGLMPKFKIIRDFDQEKMHKKMNLKLNQFIVIMVGIF